MKKVLFTAAERRIVNEFHAATVRAAQVCAISRIEYGAATKEAIKAERSAWADSDSVPMARFRIACAFLEGFAPTPGEDVTAGTLSTWLSSSARAFLAGRNARNQRRDKVEEMERLSVFRAKAEQALLARL